MTQEDEVVDCSPNNNGGIMKTIVKRGEGTTTPLAKGSRVKIHYIGVLSDNTVFDTSRDGEPFEFDLGTGSVIKAWDMGIPTMKKGEKASFVCKPLYAFGDRGKPPKIPQNATVTYEIELLGWTEDVTSDLDGGILKTIIEQTSSSPFSPKEGSNVHIYITGEYEGRVFDNRNVKYVLGEGSEHDVCEGIEIALNDMTLKEKSKLEIKSKYAFGATGKPEFDIPPNADIIYTVQLKEFNRLKPCTSVTAAERLDLAKDFKEKGTKFFKAGKYALAAKKYKLMKEYVSHKIDSTDQQDKVRIELDKAMYLNLALCYIKINKNEEAIEQCNKALEKYPDSKKALFRKGQSYLNMQEPELAKLEFEKLLDVDPKNESAAENLKKCEDMMKHQQSREKKLYANMFGKTT